MLSGEWGVLEPGTPCIVAPVSQHAVASVFPSTEFIADVTLLLKSDVVGISRLGLNLKSSHKNAELSVVDVH